MTVQSCLILLLACAGACVWAQEDCEVRARTSGGWVCGARRWSEYGGVHYASFRGVPYAKQPLGELRFKELEPLEPWDHLLNATEEGAICPQSDVLYGSLMTPRSMSEACIYANIHVPISALPIVSENGTSQLNSTVEEASANATGLPILVFIHGGVLEFGSGDSDLYGPEYLVSEGVIVITFNYRLNVFGFLSLNSTAIPGNNGLRDMITLLRWVRDNARHFGGNPDDVTLGGQSAGAVSTHLLTLSPEAQGLFKRAILMSGTAMPVFFATSPLYAQYMANAFVTGLGINSTDPDEIHQQLVEMPLENIMEMNKYLIDQNGLGVFYPVVESPLPGVKRILSDDPEVLLKNGTGKDIPLLLGFTNVEAETFRKRFKELGIMSQISDNPLLLMTPTTIFSLTTEEATARGEKILERYFNGTPNMDEYVELATQEFFYYTSLKVGEYRSQSGGAPIFMYQFAYDADFSPVRTALGLNYTGAAHVDDMTFVFQCNALHEPYSDRDYQMKGLMLKYVVNFMRYSHPAVSEGDASWRPVDSDGVRYLTIQSPTEQQLTEITQDQLNMVAFFNGIMARD